MDHNWDIYSGATANVAREDDDDKIYETDSNIVVRSKQHNK